MNIEAIRGALFSKDETHGYIEREGAIDTFLQGGPPDGQAERYVAALEYLLPRLSTPVAPGEVLVGAMVEGPIPYEIEPVPAGGKSHVDNPFRQWRRNGGHMSLDYAPMLQKGLLGIVAEMEARCATAPQREYAALARRAVEAIRAFAHRYADAAQAAGNPRAAEALRLSPFLPARDFFGALQGVWLMEMILSCATGARDYGYSRLDLALLPYFDPEESDDATEALRSFLIKNNEIGGMGSEMADHMPIPCAATNIYLMLGGRGARAALALDLLFLRAAHDVMLPQPVLALRMEKDSPAEWKTACVKAAQVLNGQAALYNDDALIPSLRAIGYTDEQALHYTMSGCNRAEYVGHQSSDCFHSTPAWLLEAYLDEAVTDMESWLARFDAVAREKLAAFTGNPRVPQAEEMRFNLESLLLHGCPEGVRDIENGGQDGETVVHNLCGLATVADSLAAVRALVFDEGAATFAEYREIVRSGFAGQDALRARAAKRLPKYGNDDPRADVWATRAGEILANAVRSIGGRIHIPSFYSLYMHHRMGELLAATPDGRPAGAPISENQSPTYGCDGAGVTALLHSAAALPQRLCGAGGLNVRFARPVDERLLLGLVDAYFAMGGVNLAFNVVSRETLIAARAHPEQYASLCVRIVGYSEVFLRLPERMQLELIARTETAV